MLSQIGSPIEGMLLRVAGDEEKEAEQGDASRRALENFCHALINSASFLYID